MSSASGITVSEGAREAFARAREEDAVLVRFQIENESINVSGRVDGTYSDEEAFEILQQNLLPSTPAFYCLRLSSVSPPSQWLFVLFVPSGSSVRDRMIFAASRENCKLNLGMNLFFDEIYANDAEELRHCEYLKQKEVEKAAAPVTQDEKLREEEKKADRDMSKQSTASVAFPISHDAQTALEKLSADEHGYVQLRLDGEKESIELVESGHADTIEEVATKLPQTEPRFVFFRYPHSFGDESFNSLLFIYICPESSPIRQKMLYSTSKAPLLTLCSHYLSIAVSKNVEVRDVADLDSRFLLSELHPQEAKAAAAPAAKPARPGKGGRRLL